MKNTIVNCNGEIVKGEEARVSLFDRGFLYGDSLYEVIRSYGDRFLYLDEHLERLQNSAHLCQMSIHQSPEVLKKEIHKTFEKYRTTVSSDQSDIYCRIIITRGVGPIGFSLSNIQTPTQYYIILQPLEPPTPLQWNKGLSLKISTRLRNDPRALDPAMKSGNYLNSILSYLEAAAENYDDALLCNAEGHLTEGTTFNIFYARGGILATPPFEIGILDGITRKKVMECAKTLALPIQEVRFPKERLFEADEVFLTSTIKEVFPVTRVDSHVIGDGKPGPLTKKLNEAYKKLSQEALKSR